jgi:hypothetical protein
MASHFTRYLPRAAAPAAAGSIRHPVRGRQESTAGASPLLKFALFARAASIRRIVALPRQRGGVMRRDRVTLYRAVDAGGFRGGQGEGATPIRNAIAPSTSNNEIACRAPSSSQDQAARVPPSTMFQLLRQFCWVTTL